MDLNEEFAKRSRLDYNSGKDINERTHRGYHQEIMKRFISDKAVNRGRQPEVDILKAFCIVMMILLHAFEYITGFDTSQLPVYKAIHFSGSFVGAAAFMICMGIGVRYSRHQEVREHIKRGFELLTVGQLLYLIDYGIPGVIGFLTFGDRIALANAMLVLQDDILTFAGLAFILLGILKKLKLSDGWILVTALIMNILNFIQYHMGLPMPESFLLRQFIAFFIVNDAECYFSLSVYFIFVAFGYYIGGIYPRISDKDGLSARILMICLPPWALYYFIRVRGLIPFLPEFDSEEQNIINFGPDAVMNCIGCLMLLALFFRLQKFIPEKVSSVIYFISAHINEYYCVSCVLISFGVIIEDIFPNLLTGSFSILVYGFIVIGLTTVVIIINNRYLRLHPVTLKEPLKTVLFSCIWLLTAAIVAYVYPKLTEYATIWNNYLLQ
ncbi:MAG: hypothetical protein J6P45_09495 [Lachnospiraceae bacterium]|nr:hypothetical protein [Lachnospiraceae bacterium]